ncbi:MAG: hypothetical protein CXZ00_00545 [Acidobacteria bacterium]|nr:MAG: hypothetical protein CXZ00_00545 [Acidobacteriota bacterium]
MPALQQARQGAFAWINGIKRNSRKMKQMASRKLHRSPSVQILSLITVGGKLEGHEDFAASVRQPLGASDFSVPWPPTAGKNWPGKDAVTGACSAFATRQREQTSSESDFA